MVFFGPTRGWLRLRPADRFGGGVSGGDSQERKAGPPAARKDDNKGKGRKREAGPPATRKDDDSEGRAFSSWRLVLVLLVAVCSASGQQLRSVDFEGPVRNWRVAALARTDEGGGESSSVSALGGTETAGGLDRRTWRDIVPVYDHPVRPFAEWGGALKFGALGAGVDIATTLLRGFNLRGSANFIDFGATIVDKGVNYFGDIHLRSGQVDLDWFPFHGGFHISPGVLIFDHRIQGGIYVPGGQMYTLEDETFTSSATDPVTGLASLKYERKFAPSLMVGWGNIIPRSGKRLTVPVEFGVAYVGRSSVDIVLKGTACQPDGCFDVATDPGSQQNLQEQINDINDDLRRVQVYPLLSIGVGYRF